MPSGAERHVSDEEARNKKRKIVDEQAATNSQGQKKAKHGNRSRYKGFEQLILRLSNMPRSRKMRLVRALKDKKKESKISVNKGAKAETKKETVKVTQDKELMDMELIPKTDYSETGLDVFTVEVEDEVGKVEHNVGNEMSNVKGCKQDKREIEAEIGREDSDKNSKRKTYLEKMIRDKGVLRYVREGEVVTRTKNVNCEERFRASQKGNIVTVAILNSRHRSNSTSNIIKITNYLKKHNIKIDSIKSCGFGKAEITFLDVVNANRSLDLNKVSEDPLVKFFIPSRVKICRGIIKDWDLDLPLSDLVSAIDNSKNIIQVERMKRRAYIVTRKKDLVYSHVVKVTLEGGNLPQYFSLYNGITRLKVRPFVEPVRQCFACLRFGHYQDVCKRYKTCITCGKAFHGPCEDTATCVNCGGNHKAMDKTCSVFQNNLEINRVKAENNISAYEAILMVRSRRRGNTRGPEEEFHTNGYNSRDNDLITYKRNDASSVSVGKETYAEKAAKPAYGDRVTRKGMEKKIKDNGTTETINTEEGRIYSRQQRKEVSEMVDEKVNYGRVQKENAFIQNTKYEEMRLIQEEGEERLNRLMSMVKKLEEKVKKLENIVENNIEIHTKQMDKIIKMFEDLKEEKKHKGSSDSKNTLYYESEDEYW